MFKDKDDALKRLKLPKFNEKDISGFALFMVA